MTQDVGSDPTVGLPDLCTLCGCEIICIFCGEADAPSEDVYMDDEGLADDEEEMQQQEVETGMK